MQLFGPRYRDRDDIAYAFGARLPGERLQERRLCSLEPVAYRGAPVVDELCHLAAEQAQRLAGGVHEHLLLEL